MPWNDRTVAGNGMVVDEMAARSVIEDEAVLFQKADDLARFDGG